MDALLAGLVAGLAIAMQIGAVSLLLIEASVVAGPRKGLAAGMRDPEVRAVEAGGTVRSHYARFLAITAVNPLTIVSFAAVAAAMSLDGWRETVAFVAGVGAASAGWHLVLTLAAGHAGRWVTPAIRRTLAIGGRVIVLAIALHLAVS